MGTSDEYSLTTKVFTKGTKNLDLGDLCAKLRAFGVVKEFSLKGGEKGGD